MLKGNIFGDVFTRRVVWGRGHMRDMKRMESVTTYHETMKFIIICLTKVIKNVIQLDV